MMETFGQMARAVWRPARSRIIQNTFQKMGSSRRKALIGMLYYMVYKGNMQVN